jgi:small subunit ribosomal protein S24
MLLPVSSRIGGQFHVSARSFHNTNPLHKIKAGRYKVTLDRTRPLTYEMAMIPEKIGTHKAFNSLNTGQLEGMLGWKKSLDRGGVLLSHKLFMEDMFIRKFMRGTWSESFVSEIIVKRQHNTVRIAGIIQKSIPARKLYFLLGYTEEMLSLWLKCPVKLELQVLIDPKEMIYKYI